VSYYYFIIEIFLAAALIRAADVNPEKSAPVYVDGINSSSLLKFTSSSNYTLFYMYHIYITF
jgi:hypothetical protein